MFDEFEDDTRFKLEEFRWDASDYLAEMSDSLFCLAPSGHGWGTRATQAVILGCIPVVIQVSILKLERRKIKNPQRNPKRNKQTNKAITITRKERKGKERKKKSETEKRRGKKYGNWGGRTK